MSNRFPPMPDLVGSVEEDTRAVADENQRPDPNNVTPRPSLPETSIVTETKICTHHITWTIDGRSVEIARLAPKGEKRGVIEACVERKGHEFKLELCASGWRNSQDGYCAFYLTSKDEDEPFVARYRVRTGDITRTSSIRHDFHLGVGFPNFCEQSIFNTVGPQELVTLSVTVEEFKCVSQLASRESKRAQGRLEVLSSVLEDLHVHRLHTDVKIVCRGLAIPVHKAVLASCSPVFQEIFQRSAKGISDELIINDFSREIVRSVVRFVYTAKLDKDYDKELYSDEQSDEKLGDLFNDFDDSDEENQQQLSNGGNKDGAADADGDWDMTETSNAGNSHILNMFRFGEKYGMIGLVVACCRIMHADLCAENTCKLLARLSPYSHVPEMQEIREAVYEYAKENYQEIKNTAGFRNLFVNHPTVIFEFLDKLV